MKIQTLYKSLTTMLMLSVFVLGTTFSFELKADQETSYTPTTLITGANRGIGLEFTRPVSYTHLTLPTNREV